MADPYDFDIAIPLNTGGKSGRGDSRSNRYGVSDDDSDNGGAGSSSVSISSSSDEGDNKKRRESGAAKQTPARNAAPVRAAAATTGNAGSSALDKAKSFLSKYSTKTVERKRESEPPSRARRLELGLDDEDFSVELSDDDDDVKPKGKDKGKKAAALSDGSDDDNRWRSGRAASATPATRYEKEDKSDHEDSFDDHGRDNDEDSVALDSPQPRTAGKCDDVDANYAEEDDNEEEDPPPPYARTAAAIPQSTVAKVSKVADSDDDIVESQEDFVQSVDEVDDVVADSVPVIRASAPVAPTGAAPKVTPTALQQSVGSESGVYEEEEFEEESTVVSDDERQHQSVRPVVLEASVAPVGAKEPPKDESNFNYSMDFDDQEVNAPTNNGMADSDARSTPLASEDELLSGGGSQEEEAEQSALLESSDHETAPPADINDHKLHVHADNEDRNSDGAGHSSDQGQQQQEQHSEVSVVYSVDVDQENEIGTIPARADEHEDFSQKDDIIDQRPNAPIAPDPVTMTETLELKQQSQSTMQPGTNATSVDGRLGSVAPTNTSSVQNPRVRIPVVVVREYEQVRKPAEMRDASTQCTGNHAGVQTDLIPDGMLNILRPTGPDVDQAINVDNASNVARKAEASAPTQQTEAPAAPTYHVNRSPPPPPQYNASQPREFLYADVASSTAAYKRQLLALQQQIQQKRQETERYFAERMSFQYTTLRGTEKDLASSRPRKIELWEALMRVDPNLSERDAREAARLAAQQAA